MKSAHLRFSTAIIKRLGEELNIGFDQGILELVKNAYDANARNCTIELLNVYEEGGTIRVSDDGDGMREVDITDGWLVLGTSQKAGVSKTRLGRVPAGNKGLGRLAALRMGHCAYLRTWPRLKKGVEFSLNIDWRRFDEAKSVDEVELIVNSEKVDAKTKPGSEIIISLLRERLTRIEVKRLARGLLLLADPFGDNKEGFQPILKSSEFKDLARMVKQRYFKDAEYHLCAKIDNNGIASAIVSDYKGAILFEADHEQLRKLKTEAYHLPKVQLDLWVFLLDAKTFSTRNVTMGEVQAWLSEFGGVHLYIDGIRVAPYGNPGDDWLGLNYARARSPEERPSTNTSIGRVLIANTNNNFLQKTDRTGLIENESFAELKSFADDAINWLARRRLIEATKKREANRLTASKAVQDEKKNVVANIAALPPAAKNKVAKVFAKYEKAREREANALRAEVQLYRTLSTAGIVATIFGHEIRRPIDLIERNSNSLEIRIKDLLGDTYAKSELYKPLKLIFSQVEKMKGFKELTLGFVEREKRRNGRVEIHETINEVLANFSIILKQRKVTVEKVFHKGKPFLRGSQAALEAVIANFIVNTLKAFEEHGSNGQPRTIRIATMSTIRGVDIHVLDNGPGIIGIELNSIWTPGESGYEQGTGLGLTIVKDTIRDLGGQVNAIAKGELGGAEFIVSLPVLGKS